MILFKLCSGSAFWNAVRIEEKKPIETAEDAATHTLHVGTAA